MNPAGFAYASTEGLAAYGHPGAIVVAGPDNYNHPDFQAVRSQGAKVLGYASFPDIPGTLYSDLNRELYRKAAPWPRFKHVVNGTEVTEPQRTNYVDPLTGKANLVADVRVNSVWSNEFVAWVRERVIEALLDGLFLDVLGTRLWAVAKWDSWPLAEQEIYTDGTLDLIRRLHELRMELKPGFILNCNNLFGDRPTERSRVGEMHCDGLTIEHHPFLVNGQPNPHKLGIAKRRFSGLNRCVIIIARSTAEAKQWAAIPNSGITHISDANGPNAYHRVTPPPVPFVAPPPPDQVLDVGGGLTVRGQRAALDLVSASFADRTRLTTEATQLQGEIAQLLDQRHRLTTRLVSVQEKISEAAAIVAAPL